MYGDGQVNWIAKSDEEIIAATMIELARLFPTEVLYVCMYWKCVLMARHSEIDDFLL